VVVETEQMNSVDVDFSCGTTLQAEVVRGKEIDDLEESEQSSIIVCQTRSDVAIPELLPT
jgi:hypothetical protein